MNDKLKKLLIKEKSNYFPNKREYLVALILRQDRYFIWKYQKLTRLIEFYGNRRKVLYLYLSYKRNKVGRKIGFDAAPGVFGEGLIIYHSFGNVVNKDARVGENCHLHGNNCIGNDGGNSDSPVIGNNCMIGVGAKIIGSIRLGNNVKIAAGAVVVKSFEEDNILLAGVPAKVVKRYQ